MGGPEGMESWSAATVEDTAKMLSTDAERGLEHEEAQSRLKKFGHNRQATYRQPSLLRIILQQLKEPMILVLVLVGIIYTFLGNPEDTLTIVVIVSLVVTIEVYSINRARKSMEALRNLTSPHSSVIRGGQVKEISSFELVPGDIMLVSAGERISADARLVEEFGLKVDESSLTGESFPVLKDSEFVNDSSQPGDPVNMIFAGTLAVQGNGRAIVTSTGIRTEIGRITGMVEEAEEPPTPLASSLNRLTVILAYIAAAFSIVIPLAGYIQGSDPRLMILTGLSLAFAIIPEELPVIVSLTLALGAYALTRKNAIVKNLRAAETLGNVTVIATDKTGTLTENLMTVKHFYTPDGDINELSDREMPILAGANLAAANQLLRISDFKKHRDPMEIAVYNASIELGIDFGSLRSRFRFVDQFSFDNRLKISSCLYREGDSLTLFASGAPEVILSRSVSVVERGAARPLLDEDSISAISALEQLSRMGERTIAIAYRENCTESEDRNVLENGLTFAGIISFIDPPRKEVRQAIKECQGAGIKVIMLTGDHPETARAVAGMVGLEGNSGVVTGSEMTEMTDQELSTSINRFSVFARITSEDKLRLVRILEDMGEIVAVTGDGVNDAPALQAAQIGIAMGERGTDVAKESADIILADDNFSTIVESVRIGRNIYHTLRKGVSFYMTVQFALVGILVVPLILRIPFPFSPIQIILLEIFMDIGALWGFLSEKPEKSFMTERPRRQGKKFIDRTLAKLIAGGTSGMIISVVLLYLWEYYSNGGPVEAQTTAFATWVIAQIVLAQNFRTEREPVFRRGFFSNTPILIWAMAVAVLLFVITAFPELQVIVSTQSLTPLDWLLVAIASFASTSWLEILKISSHSGKNAGKVKDAITET